MAKAVFGLVANIISYEPIRESVLKINQGSLIKEQIPQILSLSAKHLSANRGECLDIAHRALFIADEFLREDDLNIFE